MESKRALTHQFQKILFGLKNQMMEIKKERGIDLPQTHCRVLMLDEFGPRPQSVIIQLLGRDKSQMTKVLSILEDYNLISRSVDPSDARSYNVDLTKEGQKTVNRIQEFYNEASLQMLNGLNEKEISALDKSLGKIISNLF